MRSQVTCHLALCGAEDQRIKFKHKMKSGKWRFQDFKNNNDYLLEFQRWYIDFLVEEFGADREDIILHKIQKGCV